MKAGNDLGQVFGAVVVLKRPEDGVHLGHCSSGKRFGHGAGMLDAPRSREQRAYGGKSLLSIQTSVRAKDRTKDRYLSGATRAHQVKDGQRTLCLYEITAEIFVIGHRIGQQILEIVMDLEYCADEEAQGNQAVEAEAAGGADQRPKAEWVNDGIPAGFIPNHCEVLAVRDAPLRVSRPAEFNRLSLDRAPQQVRELGGDLSCEARVSGCGPDHLLDTKG